MNTKLTYWKKLILAWEKNVLDYLPEFFLGIVVIVVFYFLGKLAKNLSLKFYSRTFKNESTVAVVISHGIYFFFLISGTFLSLQILGLEKVLTKLLTGAGIVGIIAGFAFKDVASNLFASVLLKMQTPYRKGEWVEIDSIYGVVTEVGWITTVIKTVEGQKVFVPNQVVYNSTFTNYSSFHKRRVIFRSGVSYGDQLDLVKRCAIEEVEGIDGVLPHEDVDFFFTSIGGYSYNFELRFWIKFTNNNDYRLALSEIIMRIKKRFEKENISLAYQVLTLDFGVKGGTNIFDRPLQVMTESFNAGDNASVEVGPPVPLETLDLDSPAPKTAPKSDAKPSSQPQPTDEDKVDKVKKNDKDGAAPSVPETPPTDKTTPPTKNDDQK